VSHLDAVNLSQGESKSASTNWMMKTQNCAILGLILVGAIATGDRLVRAESIDPIPTIIPTILAQTFPPETSEGELKSWCSQAGGAWLGQSCQWQDFPEEDAELSLDRQCRDRGGIWQTLYEETIGPSICSGGFCTADAVVIDYIEKGVGCVWEDP
jgi:hypothetical protein